MSESYSLRDKTILVTGASSGLGLETALQLARLGAEIVLICRDAQRGERARRQIAAVASGPEPVLQLADVSSQASIRALAKAVQKRFSRLDVLINNAGGVFSELEVTEDGLERTFATNYLSAFMLSHLLIEELLAAPAGRIVNIASALHRVGPDVMGNLQGERSYNFMSAYRISKFAVIAFTYELARRLQGTTVTVNCVEPGPTKTAFGDQLRGLPRLFPMLMKRLPLFRPVTVGARTPVYAASSPKAAGVTGKYFLKCRAAETAPITYDAKIGTELWEKSLALTGIRADRLACTLSRLKATAEK